MVRISRWNILLNLLILSIGEIEKSLDLFINISIEKMQSHVPHTYQITKKVNVDIS